MRSWNGPGTAARSVALAVACGVALSGCGSTIQVSGSSRSLLDGSGLSAPAEEALGPGGGGPAASSGVVSGSTAGSSGLGPGTGGQVGSTAGGAAPDGATSGSLGARSAPGVTATTIRVGIAYLANGDQAARTAGVSLNRGNEKSYWQAAIAEANARGGIAGRRLVPVYYPLDAQSTQTIATQEEAECTAFTQDTRVFAVVTNGTENFTACLTRAGVLHATTGSYTGFDRDFYRRYPTYFAQRPSQDRYQADLVSSLVRQRYFSGWDTLRGMPAGGKAKVGVLVIDRPEFTRTMDRVLLPALSRAGYPVARSAVYRVAFTPSAQEAGPTSADVQAAVLGLHQQQVTHVVLLDINGTMTLLFAQQSSNQAYYPRMGVTSASGVQQLYDLKVVTAKQVNGALGLGWTPTLDLPQGQANKYLSSAAATCREVMKRRGVTVGSTTAEGLAMFSCDAVFSLATALAPAGRVLTLASAVRAYESIGRTIVTASVGRVFFSPSHHDGLEVAYDMAWDNSCTCVRYRDVGHRMP